MAKDLNCSVDDLIKNEALKKKITPKNYISENIGEYTINDILKELEKPGRDPRAVAEEFRFDDTIKAIADVRVGMRVPGIVTNITNFGAFVDIGVKQDGLLHISQMSNTYISDPNQVVKLQQQLMVTVTEVDVARKRISLSIKDEKKAKPAAPAGNKPMVNKPAAKQPALNDFQSKLNELRKKFS